MNHVLEATRLEMKHSHHSCYQLHRKSVVDFGNVCKGEKREQWLTVTTPVVTQPVISTEQIQCCVQVLVNLVYSVADSFQGHPPVGSLWLMFAGRHLMEESTGAQTQQENTGEAV